MKTLPRLATTITVLTMVGCLAPIPETAKSVPEVGTPREPSPPYERGSGTLAYIGADGNVWTTAPSQGWTRQVTDDATAPPEGQGRSYHRVAWSRHGSLAFAAVIRLGDSASGEIFLQENAHLPPQLIASNDDHFVIYLYPSPTPCSGRPDCPTLAYLVEEQNGVGLHLVTKGEGTTRDLLVAVGRPFYLSWSPDGQQILWHLGGDVRENPAAEIGVYNMVQDRRRVLPYPPGSFSAPAWFFEGEQWLGVVASDGVDRLQLLTADKAATLVTTAGHEIAFVRAPDGRRIAYSVRDPDGRPFYGPVHVMDLETGQTKRLTNEAFAISGFFWSPDSRRLAYLSRLDLPDSVWMQWRVLDLDSERDRGFAAFHPSPLMRFVVHSFGQYAQSHRFWSPDGRYLVYADRNDAGVDRVWLVDTESKKGADPILVDEGSIGIWSWR